MEKNSEGIGRDLRDYVTLFVVPTIELTRGSRRKWVRALGEIVAYTILLPWTMVSTLTVVIIAVILLVLAGVVDNVLEWWKNV